MIKGIPTITIIVLITLREVLVSFLESSHQSTFLLYVIFKAYMLTRDDSVHVDLDITSFNVNSKL